ncbi:hypothetical protein JXA59_00890 [Patescibacteria group bacterium]|nr:hypothetical protein [Patescibacteria group bacterium]
MNKLDKTLQEYGLNVKEAKIYLALLELGRAPILAIAKQTKIKRAGLYYTIQGLVKKGLATEVKIGKKRLWEPLEPEQLLAREDERHRLITHAMPELKALHNLTSGEARITYYRGFTGINRLDRELVEYAATLPKEQREFLEYGNIDDILSGKFSDLDKTTNRRIGANTPIRMIAPATPTAKKKAHDPKGLRQVILVPNSKQADNVIYLIVGDKIALYSLDENDDPAAVLITHPGQARLQRDLFNLAWRSLAS